MQIGQCKLDNPVFLAPMTGVSDLPFRKLANALGAGLVVSEMVASSELVRNRKDVVRRARGDALDPYVIQLVGCDAYWMAEGARMAEGLGADVIDINMGCPRREVTGKLSGSALMRDLDHAISLITAVVKAVSVPVTLKMRLGWDNNDINAPELARRAQQAGVQMVTVHARTRCQFFKGKADWARVAPVSRAISIPVIVNGDIKCVQSARDAIVQSEADGVMIGRGAYGAPWLPGQVARALRLGTEVPKPSLDDQSNIARSHVESMLSFYGEPLGLRNARKHIGWYLEQAGRDNEIVKTWRRRLCTDNNAIRVLQNFAEFYSETIARKAEEPVN